VLPSATYRLTSYDEDVDFDGDTYTATPISRGNIEVTTLDVSRVRELTISIARDHAVAQALRANGSQPDALVTVARFHIGDAEDREIHQGYIRGTTSEGAFMRMKVPNRVDEAFSVSLPIVTAQRTCPHRLYDRGCTVDPVADGFVISPTVASISGTSLVVSSISGKPDQWARFGKVTRTSDGVERRILAQSGTTLTLGRAFGTLEVGDALEVYAGCDHSVETCLSKFDNVDNFGGEPEMPIGNPTAPTGYGVVVQV
jgi:uncharacterized phage protein (TIGR02218 family)